jgi:hypothetical protein
MLFGVLLYDATRSAPRVTDTADGAHSVNALTGAADHSLHEAQWQ